MIAQDLLVEEGSASVSLWFVVFVVLTLASLSAVCSLWLYSHVYASKFVFIVQSYVYS